MNLSATTIQCYLDCPRRYYFSYVVGLMQRDNRALEIGKAYHSILEIINEYSLNEAIKRVCSDMPESDMIKRMVEVYLQNPVNGVVVDREKKFKLFIDDIPVVGKIDRVDEDKILDYKTTSVDYKYEDCLGIQTDIYIWAMEVLTGVRYPFVYSIVNKKKLESKKYKAQILTVDLKDYSKENTIKTIKDTYAKIKAKEFSPNPGSQCFFCPFGRKNGTGNCEHSL